MHEIIILPFLLMLLALSKQIIINQRGGLSSLQWEHLKQMFTL